MTDSVSYYPAVPRTVPQERFQDLVEAAVAVFIEQGYRRTQMADVAARLGVAKGTLYLYVESKEALLHAALGHADARQPVELPPQLPLPSPPPGATLQMVEKRVAEEATLPVLAGAVGRRRVTDVRGELEAIVRELYDLLSSHRRSIKLLDRCAHDHPELAAVWYRAGRIDAMALLTQYLEERMRRGRMRRFADVSVAARIVLETLVFWAVHRHWDPAPQALDESAAADTVVAFIVAALCKETPR
jgi:AcrR family transcriptional regulator